MDLSALIETTRSTPAGAALRTLLTALVGAAIGAWFSNRGTTKRRVIDELNATRTAIALAFQISNHAISIKSQHTLDMKQKYDAAKKAHAEFLAKPTGTFILSLDLRTLSPFSTPTTLLERSVFEKTNLQTRGLVTATSLIAAVDNLKNLIAYRNNLIDEFRTHTPRTHDERVRIYLGLPGADGMTDARFETSVAGLYVYTDDCIFFSQRLMKELLIYGNKLRRRYAWRYRLPVRKFKEATWSKAEKAGLLPSADHYAKWTSGFLDEPTRAEKIVAWVKRLRSKIW